MGCVWESETVRGWDCATSNGLLLVQEEKLAGATDVLRDPALAEEMEILRVLWDLGRDDPALAEEMEILKVPWELGREARTTSLRNPSIPLCRHCRRDYQEASTLHHLE